MSCGGPLYRRRQILGKLESGCAEPAILSAVDGGVEVAVSPQANPEVTMNERDVARISLTKLQSIPGEVKGSITFSSEFKGSGEKTTPPSIDQYLQACGLEKRALQRIDAPELAGVDVPYGSVLTVALGPTKLGNVVVPIDSENFDGYVYYEVPAGSTGLALGDVVTITFPDATTDTFTTTVAEEPVGFTYTPISTGMKTITIRSEEDTDKGGYKKEIYGAMGTFALNAESSALGKFEFTFNGVVSKGYVKNASFTTTVPQWNQIVGETSGAKALLVRGVTAPTTDAEIHYVYQNDISFVNGENLLNSAGTVVGAVSGTVTIPDPNPEYRGGFGDFPMTTGVVFDETNPPILQDAQVRFMDEAVSYKPIFAAVGIDAANDVVVRKDANSVNGLKEALVTGRSPSLTIDPEMMAEIDFDIFNRWFNGEPISLGFKLGKGADQNSLYVHAKKAQFTGLSDGDRDSMATVSVEAMLSGDTDDVDDEYKLVFF